MTRGDNSPYRRCPLYEGLGLMPIVFDGLSDGTLRYIRLILPEGEGTFSIEQGQPTGLGIVVYFRVR